MMLADARKSALTRRAKTWAGQFALLPKMVQACEDPNLSESVRTACNNMRQCRFDTSQAILTVNEDPLYSHSDHYTGVGSYPGETTTRVHLSCPGGFLPEHKAAVDEDEDLILKATLYEKSCSAVNSMPDYDHGGDVPKDGANYELESGIWRSSDNMYRMRPDITCTGTDEVSCLSASSPVAGSNMNSAAPRREPNSWTRPGLAPVEKKMSIVVYGLQNDR